ncbi:unnamed protein product [Closterium sp. Naga37s-1]|nr:unnamed protein product [Closterium sp. Naga37s-1]
MPGPIYGIRYPFSPSHQPIPWFQDKRSGTLRSNTPRANTPRANTPRANTPRANTPRANNSRANTPRANTSRANTRGAKLDTAVAHPASGLTSSISTRFTFMHSSVIASILLLSRCVLHLLSHFPSLPLSPPLPVPSTHFHFLYPSPLSLSISLQQRELNWGATLCAVPEGDSAHGTAVLLVRVMVPDSGAPTDTSKSGTPSGGTRCSREKLHLAGLAALVRNFTWRKFRAAPNYRCPGAEEAAEGAEEAAEGAEEAAEGAEEAVEGAEEAVEGAEEAVEGADEREKRYRSRYEGNDLCPLCVTAPSPFSLSTSFPVTALPFPVGLPLGEDTKPSLFLLSKSSLPHTFLVSFSPAFHSAVEQGANQLIPLSVVRSSSPPIPHPLPSLIPSHPSSPPIPHPLPSLIPSHPSSPPIPHPLPSLTPSYPSSPPIPHPLPSLIPSHPSSPPIPHPLPSLIPSHPSSPPIPHPLPSLIPSYPSSPPIPHLLKALCSVNSRFLPSRFVTPPFLLSYPPAPPSYKQARQWWHGTDYRRGLDWTHPPPPLTSPPDSSFAFLPLQPTSFSTHLPMGPTSATPT